MAKWLIKKLIVPRISIYSLTQNNIVYLYIWLYIQINIFHSESDEDETKQLVDDIELQIVPIIPKTRPKLEDDSPVSPK